MNPEPKVVAILTANRALTSLLHAVLRTSRDLRVRMFESEAELSLYMHIAPVDLLICDFDAGDGAAHFLPRLRAMQSLARPAFQAIALTRSITPATRAACVEAGIDELIVKPMSPRHLEERVAARLRDGPRHIVVAGYAGPERRSRIAQAAAQRASGRSGSNVVPLFADRRHRAVALESDPA